MSLKPGAWKTITWREGTNAPQAGRFAALRVRPAHRDQKLSEPRPREWLLIEWPKGEAEPTKYWLSTLPRTTKLADLVAMTKQRWRIERTTGTSSRRSGSDDLSRSACPFFSWRRIEVGGVPLKAARLSYSGELGWELYVPAESAGLVYDSLFAAGADLGLRDAGTQALTSLRIEKGYRAWDHELSPEDTPLEAGLGFAVKLDKEIPFIGRDALLRQRDRGPAKRLIHFTFDDPTIQPLGDDPILQGGEVVSQVTSAAFGHSLGRGVAMGYLRLDGTPAEETIAAGGFSVDMAGTVVPVTASLEAPYDPKGLRLRV